MEAKRIAMIGLGQMGRALAEGWVRTGLLSASQLAGWDPLETARQTFAASLAGVRIGHSNREIAEQAEVILLAVKPHLVREVAGQIRGVVDQRQLIISVAAGITLAELARQFGTERIVRVMPNTPCLLGQGALAYAPGSAVSQQDREQVRQLLHSVGAVFAVDERAMDAVTGLSGSGPAYVYLMIEALSDGGVRAGLPRDLATALAARTVRGAAEMVLASGEHPAVLRERVTSPGGTTIAGLEALERHGMRAACMAAVAAATARSIELRTPDDEGQT